MGKRAKYPFLPRLNVGMPFLLHYFIIYFYGSKCLPYERKTNRQCWSEDAMFETLDAVGSGTSGYLKAAKKFNVPNPTMGRPFQNKNKQWRSQRN